MTRNRSAPRDERSGTGRARQRTVSISAPVADRGQTTQDFAVGIGIFILAVAFVFSFLPSIVAPYDSAVGGAETAQADRIADRALEEFSTDTPNEISSSDIDDIEDGDWDDKDLLAETFGLRTADGGNVLVDRLNVSIYELGSDSPVTESGDTWAFGPEYDDQPAASSARIVTVEGEDEPAYRLVVRVW